MGCGASSPAAVQPKTELSAPEKTVSIVPSPPATAGPASEAPAAADPAHAPPSKKATVARAMVAEPAVQAVAAASSSDEAPPANKIATLDLDTLREAFLKHDTSGDGTLSKAELSTLLEGLLGDEIKDAKDENGAPVLDALLEALDADGSGDIDLDELLAAWRAWFGKAMNPVRCLLIIDVQNDFISGTLSIANCPAKQDPTLIVPVINRMRRDLKWDEVAVSLDWHPHMHCSFAECFADTDSRPVPLHESQDAAEAVGPPVFSSLNLLSPDGESQMKQILWPRHCVQDTWGAECHPDLVTDEKDVLVYKGTDYRVDSYSAFYDNQKLNQTSLLESLRSRGVTHLFLVGLALDVCVAFSALHAAEEGFVVTVVLDGCAGVSEEGIAEKKECFQKAGINVATSDELPTIFAKSSIDELTHAALRVKKAKAIAGTMQFEASHGAFPAD